MELWSHLSEHTKQAIVHAHTWAVVHNRGQINSAQLVLGLVQVGEGEGFERLKALSDLPGLVGRLEEIAASAPSGNTDEIAFTGDAQRVLTRAYEAARAELGPSNVTTRHLLLGLLRESDIRQMLLHAGLSEE